MERYKLTEEVKNEYTPIIKEFIDNLASDNEDVDDSLNLSDTKLNPYTLGKILENEFEYQEDDISHNGWQMDFCIYYTKEGMPDLCIEGCGITFELILRIEY